MGPPVRDASKVLECGFLSAYAGDHGLGRGGMR